jgi:hypothetical protein
MTQDFIVGVYEDDFMPPMEIQRLQVLHFLQRRVGECLTMAEIVEATNYKAPARITELIKLGHDIEIFKIEGKRKRLYRLNAIKESVEVVL